MSPSATHSAPLTANDVLCYIPNLIGYGRVALMAAALTLWLSNTAGDATTVYLATLFYIAAFAGDLIDGWVARKLHQTSTWGGVLDMVTDRCSTAGLLVVLATLEAYAAPMWRLIYVTLILLDVSSHWCQMYASLACNTDGQQHHKSEEANAGRNFLVRWFYKYYWFFGYLCVGTEFTYILLLLWPYVGDGFAASVIKWGLRLCTPACVAKQVVNVAQLTSAAHAIAAHDAMRQNQARKGA